MLITLWLIHCEKDGKTYSALMSKSNFGQKNAGQTNSQTGWEYRYSGIEGFDYEPHYEYTLLIKNTTVANPLADASSIHSKLIKIIEKKRTIE